MAIIEKKLKESEERFKALFKGGPIPTYAWQKVGKFFKLIDFNNSAKNITQGNVGKYIGITASEMYKHRPDILNDLNRCFNERINITKEMKYSYNNLELEKDLLVTYSYIPPDSVLVHTEDITYRNIGEQKLKESEEKYRTLTEQSFVGVAILQDDVIQYINKQLALTVGYTVEEILAWEKGGFLNLLYPEDREFIVEQARKKQAGESDVTDQYEFRVVKKNGDIIWLEVFSKTINYRGKPADFVTIHDINEKKISEQKIKESEEKYRNLFNNVPFAIVLFNTVGNILDCNDASKIITGYSKEELIGKNFRDFNFYVDIKSAKIDEREDQIKKGKTPLTRDVLLQRKDGSHFWARSRIEFVHVRNESYIQAIIQDVSEQKQSQLELKESESKFRHIFEAIPDSYFLVSSDSTILDYRGKEQEFDVRPEEFMGKKVIDFLPSNLSKSIVKLIRKTLRTQQQQSLEYELQIKDQKHFYESRYFYMSKDKVSIFIRDITQRKNIEKQISDLSKFTDDILNSSMDIIFVFNPKSGRAVRWNDQFKKVSGYTDKEIASIKAPDSYFNEEGLKRAAEAIKNVLEKGKTKVELSLITKDGKSIPYEYTGTIIKDSSGEILIVSVGRDISERNIAEKRIKESEEKFRDLYEDAPIAYFSISPKKSILRVNKAAEKLLGYNKEEFLRMNVFDLYTDTDNGLKRAKEVFEKFIAGESIKDIELQMANKEGNPIWVSLSVKPVFDTEGNVIESRSIVLDINDRKIAQEEVRNSYKRLEELEYIINNSPGVVFLWKNSEGWPVEFVSENVDQWGYSPEDFYSGKVNYEQIIYPDDLQRVSEEVAIYSNEDISNFVQEYRIITKTGEIRWLDDRSWIRRDSNENITHFQGIVLDITDRKIAEETLRLSEKKYKDAYDRGNFYKALFAHDINNILQVINSSAELITYQLGESEKSKEIESISDIIKKQVIRGSKLISNVRTLSELEEKEIITHRVEIGSFLKSSISFVEKAYEERNVNISVFPIDGKYFTIANELLQDVFENVLINGIKYNEKSKVEILIRISRHQIEGKKYFKFEFIDNGIGVTDNRKEVIFKSGNRELKGSKGMGLGLSLVNKILEIFNGKIWVEDKVKGDYTKGSNFLILLPEVQ